MERTVKTDLYSGVLIADRIKIRILAILEYMKSKVGHWRIPLYLGIVFIFAGLLTLILPFENLELISVSFGFIILISGMGEITFAILKRTRPKGWAWFLAGGFIDFLVGLLFIYHTGFVPSLLSLYVAFWLMFRSTMAIGVLSKQQTHASVPWSSLLLFVLAALSFAFFVLMRSNVDGDTLVNAAAVFCMVLGVFRIFIAIGLKRIVKSTPKFEMYKVKRR